MKLVSILIVAITGFAFGWVCRIEYVRDVNAIEFNDYVDSLNCGYSYDIQSSGFVRPISECELITTIDSIRCAGKGENTSERIARVLEQIVMTKEQRK